MKTLLQIYADLVAEHGKYCTDKGGTHSYLPIYEAAFAPLRHQPVSLLEAGVRHGSSLVLWNRYFLQAAVVGLDTEPDLKVDIRPATLLPWDASKVDCLFRVYDIIIDDGDHSLESQLRTYANLRRYLKPGGLYFIEDTYGRGAWEIRRELQKELSAVRIYDLRALDRRSDSMLVQVFPSY